MKTKNHSRARSRKTSGLAEAAVAATVELGHAAESFQESLEHLKKARQRGSAVTKKVVRTVKQTGKSVAWTARRAVKPRKK